MTKYLSLFLVLAAFLCAAPVEAAKVVRRERVVVRQPARVRVVAPGVNVNVGRFGFGGFGLARDFAFEQSLGAGFAFGRQFDFFPGLGYSAFGTSFRRVFFVPADPQYLAGSLASCGASLNTIDLTPFAAGGCTYNAANQQLFVPGFGYGRGVALAGGRVLFERFGFGGARQRFVLRLR